MLTYLPLLKIVPANVRGLVWVTGSKPVHESSGVDPPPGTGAQVAVNPTIGGPSPGAAEVGGRWAKRSVESKKWDEMGEKRFKSFKGKMRKPLGCSLQNGFL